MRPFPTRVSINNLPRTQHAIEQALINEDDNNTLRVAEFNLEQQFRPVMPTKTESRNRTRVSPKTQSSPDLLKKHATYPTLHDSDGGDKQESPAPSQTSMVTVP